MKQISFYIGAFLIMGSCLSPEHPFVQFSGYAPANISDGWQISTPGQEQMDEVALADLYESLHQDESLWQLRSMLVIKNGKLVAESYFKNDQDRTTPLPIWSCTKQILGVLTGVALEQGVLHSLQDSLPTYLQVDWTQFPDKQDITIEQCLLMRSGIQFDERKDVAALLQLSPDNTLEYLLSLPMQENPESVFHYNSGDPHLVAAAIQHATAQPLTVWANEVLFSHIGFTNYTWLAYDGLNFGGYGISTTARELAKIAQLVLNKGNWKGEQLVNSDWMDEMIARQSETEPSSEYGFGYLWWNNEGEGLHFMAGSGGQYACIDPDNELIVILRSEHDTDGDLEIDFETALELVNRVRATVN